MESSESPLPALVAAVARRDAQALARLVDACLPRIYGLALRITRSPLLAEQVAQDVFVDVWNGAAGGPPTPAWLATLCRTRALALVRGVRAELRPTDGRDGVADLQYLATATCRCRPFGSRLLALDDRQRELLGLCLFEGLGAPELAERTGLPPATIVARLRSAMAVLRHDAAQAAAV